MEECVELSHPCLQAKLFNHNRRIAQFKGQIGQQEDGSAVPEGFKEVRHCFFGKNNPMTRSLAQASYNWRKPFVLQRLCENHATLTAEIGRASCRERV